MDVMELRWALVGGILIGLSASLLLLLKGRIFGVSGILAGVLSPKKGDLMWRYAILGGFFAAGILLNFLWPDPLIGNPEGSLGRYAVAGLLVGFGTQLGNGCTSGHGICGVSRLSVRSIAATITFIVTAILAVAATKVLGGMQ